MGARQKDDVKKSHEPALGRYAIEEREKAEEGGRMNSFAIWIKYEKVEKCIESIPEIHANIWYDKHAAKNKYMEFGLKMDSPFPDYVCIYLPYDAGKEVFQDLSPKFKDNKMLVEALFNTSAEVNGNIAELGGKKKIEFISCNVDKIIFEDISCDQPAPVHGVAIQIPVNNKSDFGLKEKEISKYLRFRINKVEKMDRTTDSNITVLEGVMKKTIFIEFNLNNIRKLPKKIVNDMHEHIYKFKKLHLFAMFSNQTDLYFFNKDIHDARVLENHVWDEYIRPEETSNSHMQDRRNIEKIVAYHWKESRDAIEDFSLFMKAKNSEISPVAVIKMIVILLLFGMFGSIIADFVEYLLSLKIEEKPVIVLIGLSGLIAFIL